MLVLKRPAGSFEIAHPCSGNFLVDPEVFKAEATV
jgi:hypothetical protein